jgi:hypothetical protein
VRGRLKSDWGCFREKKLAVKKYGKKQLKIYENVCDEARAF